MSCSSFKMMPGAASCVRSRSSGGGTAAAAAVGVVGGGRHRSSSSSSRHHHILLRRRAAAMAVATVGAASALGRHRRRIAHLTRVRVAERFGEHGASRVALRPNQNSFPINPLSTLLRPQPLHITVAGRDPRLCRACWRRRRQRCRWCRRRLGLRQCSAAGRSRRRRPQRSEGAAV